MRRVWMWSWPLMVAAALAAVWPGALREIGVGSVLGTAMMALSFLLFRRTLQGSFESFMMAFGAVFASQALSFLALAALAWKGGWAPAPLLLAYGPVAVGGTVAVAMTLPIGKTRKASHAAG